MSSLSMAERMKLESLLRMSSGYVLNFSDQTFGEFVFETVGLDIHDEKYTVQGTSKAKKLREFWKVESDHVVGELLKALIEYEASWTCSPDAEWVAVQEQCREVVARLLAGGPALSPLKEHAKLLNANHLAGQIRRLEASVDEDPELAIGTAKELIETYCKTILAERGKPVEGTPKISDLTTATLRELNLVPEGIPEAARGAKIIKVLLSNLGTIGNGLAELRGLYGTGHGKHGSATGLSSRHARLAVGAAATLVTFLFETFQQASKTTMENET